MFIKELTVKNYMCHKNTKLELRPITVFVGPQGGGKSALFDAILNFSIVSRGAINQAFGPYPYSFNATRYSGANDLANISYSVTLLMDSSSDVGIEYELSYRQTRGDHRLTIMSEIVRELPSKETIFDRSRIDDFELSNAIELTDEKTLLAAVRMAELSGRNKNIPKSVSYFAGQISRFNRFRLDPVVMAQPSRLPDPDSNLAPRIGYHGEDLASTLYYLNEKNTEVLEIISLGMGDIDPAFERLDFRSVGSDRIAFDFVYSDVRGAVPSAKSSSGTLSFLGLLTLVASPNRPPLLMIEEPENGLTPQAVRCKRYDCPIYYGGV